MEVRDNNLYRNGTIIDFMDSDEQLLVREPITTKGTLTDVYHTVRNYDRLDLLAAKYYRDQVEDPSKYWWVIADANNIHEPLNLLDYIGKEILIPNIFKILIQE